MKSAGLMQPATTDHFLLLLHLLLLLLQLLLLLLLLLLLPLLLLLLLILLLLILLLLHLLHHRNRHFSNPDGHRPCYHGRDRGLYRDPARRLRLRAAWSTLQPQPHRLHPLPRMKHSSHHSPLPRADLQASPPCRNRDGIC